MRTFAGGRSSGDFEFIHAETDFRPRRRSAEDGDTRLPRPLLPNVDLLLGDNGSGKSSVLRAIAASAFGPAARDTLRDGTAIRFGETMARISAELRLHEQDRGSGRGEPDGAADHIIPSDLTLERRGERLIVDFPDKGLEPVWRPVYDSRNDAFFVVGYGATRRVERLDTVDSGARLKLRSARDLRVLSLLEDAFSLIPLGSWLPRLKTSNPGRYKQVERRFEALLKPGGYRFTGRPTKGETTSSIGEGWASRSSRCRMAIGRSSAGSPTCSTTSAWAPRPGRSSSKDRLRHQARETSRGDPSP